MGEREQKVMIFFYYAFGHNKSQLLTIGELKILFKDKIKTRKDTKVTIHTIIGTILQTLIPSILAEPKKKKIKFKNKNIQFREYALEEEKLIIHKNIYSFRNGGYCDDDSDDESVTELDSIEDNIKKNEVHVDINTLQIKINEVINKLKGEELNIKETILINNFKDYNGLINNINKKKLKNDDDLNAAVYNYITDRSII